MKETAANTNEAGSETATEHEAFHATVHGTVQGVGFRYFTQMSARRVGVTGWVRNRQDGTVEVYAEGTKPRLRQLIKALYRGPTHSHVTEVAVTWKTATGDPRTFRIRA
jgi:acylphosphatase